MRNTGIDVIGDVPWGTHFCQFYETGQDLIETLVPYFKEGLAANEFCMWVTSEPLQVRQAKAALKEAVPDLEKRIRQGQIEISDYGKWYTRLGKFSAQEVLQGWIDKLNAALEKGYAGLRLTGNTFWLEKADWEDFRLYEEAVNGVIGRYKMLAICTYSLKKCGATEIIDVVANHEFALIKRQGRWETVESSKQRQSEQDLKRAHEILEAVTRGSKVIMAAVDKDYRYTFFNKEYEAEIKQLTGKDMHIGSSLIDLFSHIPEQQKVAVEEWSQVLRGETTNKILEFGDPGIHRRVYSIHHTPLRDALGRVVGAGEVAYDITEQAGAEETLRRERDFSAAVLQTAGALVVVLDNEGRITRFNRACEAMTGCSEAEVLGRVFWDFLVPAEDLPGVRQAWGALQSGDFPNHHENQWLAKDGSRRLISWSNSAIVRSDGKIDYIIGTGIDITERRKAREELHRTREHLENLIDYANAPIIVWDFLFKITRFNHAFERLTGLMAEEVIGKPLDILFPEASRDESLAHIQRTLTGERWEVVEIPILRTDGTIRTVLWNSANVYEKDGTTLIATIAQGQDITERKRMEEETRRLASFPMLNPQPVVEVDEAGHIGFANPAAQTLFPDLRELGPDHPWLADWETLLESFRRPGAKLPTREVKVGERWYHQSMALVSEPQRLRIYGIDISGRVLAEQELRRHAEELETARTSAENQKLRLEAVMEALPVGVAITDALGENIKANSAFEGIWGGPRPEAKTVDDYAAYRAWWADTERPVSPEEWASAQAIKKDEPVIGQVLRIQRFDGSHGFVINSAAPVRDAAGSVIGSAVAVEDITDLRRTQDELYGLNRTLTALSHSNQALMRAKNEADFLNEACQIIIKDCGHAMVWIGYAQDDEQKSVRPVASAGFEAGYLETLNISWADTERGRGPTGTAIRTGKPCACTDMLTDPKFAPWREQAVARGYASSLVLPFLVDGKASGSISIYFKQAGAIPEEEIQLLTELASDVACGVTSIRLREAHARAEEALRESEERLATFAAATFEGIVLSLGSVIVDCNEQFAKMAGRPVADLKGEPIEQFIALEDRERVVENFRLGRESTVEHQMLRADGSRLIVEVHGRPSGRLRFSAVRDITARKMAEEALRQRTEELQHLTETLEQRVQQRTAELEEANELLQAEVTHSHFMEDDLRKQKEALQIVIDNIPVMLCFYDSAGKAKMTNREFDRLLSWSKEEAEDLDIAPKKTRKATARPETQVSATDGIPGWREHNLKTRGGDDLESSWATVRLSDGGQIGIGLDMRERRAAERERLRLAAAVEQADNGMGVMDAEGIIIYVNPAFERTAGSVRADLLGRRYYGLLNGDGTVGNLAEDVEKTIRGGGTWSGRLARKTKDGQSRELDITVSPIRDRSGNVINYLVLERDVTQDVRLQQHLRQVQKMEALGTLAGGIAHDFNNILNPIFINTELSLMDAALDDETRRALEITLRAAERGRDLVKQIITFSRQKEKERKPTKVGPVIKEAVKFLRSSLTMTVEIRQNVERETGFVLADPTQIHQVVMNLCNNAAFAMRERGGLLDVSLAEIEVDEDMAERHPDLKPGSYLRLTIADTGTGMAPEVMERAFDPFFTTKKPGEGSGMGLAVVHGIVRDYAGAVTVYSEPGRGTTFNIFLPRVPAEGIQPEAAAEGLTKGMERILVVDDEDVQVQSIRNMLKRLGYRVTAKTDSAEALKVFRKDPGHFDLLITDQTMPGLTGAQLAQEILRIRPDMPIILCTGFSDRVDASGSRTLGIREFLMKPFSIREMSAAINRAMKKA